MLLFPRRLSAPLVVAIIALFVALAGTAAAAVIITSPDQLASDVITSPKIVKGAVAQSDERNPSLRAKIAKNGTVITGDVPGGVVDHPETGRYDVTMSLDDLGPLGLDTCAVSANPSFDLVVTSQGFDHRNLRAYANVAKGSSQVNVFMFESRVENGVYDEEPVDAPFDLVLAC
jgi:hypothetical protein